MLAAQGHTMCLDIQNNELFLWGVGATHRHPLGAWYVGCLTAQYSLGRYC